MSRRAPPFRSPLPPGRLLGAALTLALAGLAGGCAPDLGAAECERDLECPDDRPVCTTGRCVARPGTSRPDAEAPSLDATSEVDRGAGGSRDAAPPTDLRTPEPDARTIPPDAAPPPADLRVPTPDGRPSPEDAAAEPGDLAPPPTDVSLAVDVGVAVPIDVGPVGDAGPIGSPDATRPPPDGAPPPHDAVVPPGDGAPPSPDAFAPSPDAFAPPPDGGCVVGPERCNGADDDCDGEVDEDVLNRLYQDADGDRWGTANATVQTCEPALPGFVEAFGDCDDGDAAVHPDAPEICNGEDDDCDGTPDEDAGALYFLDRDGDGFGDPEIPTERYCTPPDGWVLEGGDCAPRSVDDHPGADERCDFVDNDCDGATDEPSIPECEAPNADGACSADHRFCRPVCHDGYSNPNVVFVDGCERGCTPQVPGLELGAVAAAGERFGVARTADHWAVAAVTPDPLNANRRRLVLFRDAAPLAILEEGALTFGQPAVARTPAGWLVATRITSQNPMPVQVHLVPDGAQQIVSVILQAQADGDPAVVVGAAPDDGLVYLAWIAGANFGAPPTPKWTVLDGRTLESLSPIQAVDGEYVALPATPSLALFDDRPLIAFAALKQVEPKLILRDLVPSVNPRTAGVSISARPERVRVVSRAGDVITATSPPPGAAADIHRFSLFADTLVAADAPLSIGVGVVGAPGQVELISTSTGFLVAFDAAVAGAVSETRAYPLELTLNGLALVGAPIHLLAGDGRRLVVASDPSGTRHTGAWIKTGSAETVYAAGTLECE